MMGAGAAMPPEALLLKFPQYLEGMQALLSTLESLERHKHSVMARARGVAAQAQLAVYLGLASTASKRAKLASKMRDALKFVRRLRGFPVDELILEAELASFTGDADASAKAESRLRRLGYVLHADVCKLTDSALN